LDYNKTLIGTEQKILVVQKDRKGRHLSGVNEGKIIVRFASNDETLIGKFVKVKVTSVVDFATEGELIKVYEEENIEA
jgi:tRNA-2-methylthio-N6-dimethylallyladenosine synthase